MSYFSLVAFYGVQPLRALERMHANRNLSFIFYVLCAYFSYYFAPGSPVFKLSVLEEQVFQMDKVRTTSTPHPQKPRT